METNQYIKELKMQKPLLYFFLIALLTFGGINVSGIDQINAQSDFPGKGIHWDTHGPWKLPFSTSKRSMDEIREFWKQNDSFFFSKVGVSGAMSAQMIIFNKK